MTFQNRNSLYLQGLDTNNFALAFSNLTFGHRIMVGDEWAQRLGESAGQKVDALSPISQERECELGDTGAIACGICPIICLHLATTIHIVQTLTSSPWDRLHMHPRGSLPVFKKHMG
jgi:hypothetical protein